MIQIHLKHIEIYICVLKVFNAQKDDWYQKGLNIRIGSYAYSLKKGWRNWRKEA